MGVKFAATTMYDLLSPYLPTKKKELQKSVSQVSESLATKTEPPAPRQKRCEVMYGRHDLYQTDQVGSSQMIFICIIDTNCASPSAVYI